MSPEPQILDILQTHPRPLRMFHLFLGDAFEESAAGEAKTFAMTCHHIVKKEIVSSFLVTASINFFEQKMCSVGNCCL